MGRMRDESSCLNLGRTGLKRKASNYCHTRRTIRSKRLRPSMTALTMSPKPGIPAMSETMTKVEEETSMKGFGPSIIYLRKQM